jgi:hypothetical protein
MENRRFQNSLNHQKSINISILEWWCEELTSEEIYENKKIVSIASETISNEVVSFIEYSIFNINSILLDNAKNNLSEKDIDELFILADKYKNNWVYEKANEIFWILLDYFIHNEDSWIEIFYETNNFNSDDLEQDYNYYYDLAVICYKDKYLCIPLPLLSKNAIKIFFQWWIKIIDRKNHYRDISFDNLEINDTNKTYNSKELTTPKWVLNNWEYSNNTIEDLII